MERIGSLPVFLTGLIPEMTNSHSFHGGKQEELIRFVSEEEDQANYKLLVTGSKGNVFPLIWLVGNKMKPEPRGLGYRFTNIKLVFMEITNKEYLNTERWEVTFPKLRENVKDFIDTIKESKKAIIVNDDWEAYEEENFAINKRNAVVEHVDAIVFEFDLIVYDKTNC